jgi:hypothetical protein
MEADADVVQRRTVPGIYFLFEKKNYKGLTVIIYFNGKSNLNRTEMFIFT